MDNYHSPLINPHETRPSHRRIEWGWRSVCVYFVFTVKQMSHDNDLYVSYITQILNTFCLNNVEEYNHLRK